MYAHEHIVNTVRKLNAPVMVCLETAADFLGLSNGGYLPSYQVYSEKPLNTDTSEKTIEVIIEDAFNTKNYITKHGVTCTAPEQTILDLLDGANRLDLLDNPDKHTDIQILLESLSNYYYEHNESFEPLTKLMNQHQLQVFNSYSQDAIDYYTED